LPLLLLPAQLLADHGPEVAGGLRQPLRPAARLDGLPAVRRAPLAARILVAAEILSRLPFLAGCLLSGGPSEAFLEDGFPIRPARTRTDWKSVLRKSPT